MVVPTDEIRELVAKYVDPNDCVQFNSRSWPGFGMVGLTYPTGFSVPKRVVLNRLVWPQQAAKFAYMFLLCDANQLNGLHDTIFGADGQSYNNAPLVLDSATEQQITQGQSYEQITTNMYLLPPKPLSFVLSGQPQPVPGDGPTPPSNNYPTNNLYLLTLVDERYFWHSVPFLPMTFADTTQFTDILNNINGSLAAAFSTEITMDAVNSAYLNASNAFKLPYEPIPYIIDALAFNLNMKFVRTFSGNASIQLKATATTNMTNDFTANPNRNVIMGGDEFPSQLPYP